MAMLSNLLAYSGIVTKSRAMEAHLLKPSDYEKIAGLNSVADFVLFLKGTPGYRDLFSGLDEHSLHRDRIEDILATALYEDYSRLFRFAGKKQRNGLCIIYSRYEINIIKACLKQALDSSSQLDLSTLEPFFSRHSRLDLNRLSQAHTMEEVVAELKGSEYEPLLRSLSASETATLQDYELALDAYYYKKSWKLCQTLLKGSEQKAFKDTFGKQIDLLNLTWIYRSKKYYDMDPMSIYASLIPIHYKVTEKQMVAMTEAPSVLEFMNLLRSTPYHNAASSPKKHSRKDSFFVGASLSAGNLPSAGSLSSVANSLSAENSFSMEEAYRQLVDKAYLDNKRRNPVSICALYHYLYLKEREIDRLTTALECIRYQLEPSKSLNYILK